MTGPARKLCIPGAAIGFAAALVLAPGARGQAVSEFRLPPASATPRPAGPVDSDNPVVAPSAPAPTPTPNPAPTVTVPQPQATPARAPAAAARPGPASPPVTAPAVSGGAASHRPASGGPAPSLEPTRSPASHARPASAEPAAPPSVPSARPVAPASAPVSAPEPAPEPASDATPSSGPSWWWLAVAALAGALGTALVIAVMRRRDAPAGPWIEPAAVPVPAPAPVPAPVADPPTPPATAAAFGLALDPVRLSLSLINATLHYRLLLTNASDRALGPVALAADMIAAHASLPEEQQLARDGTALELRHQLPGLAPGESVELSGELRLPLASITPIRSGSAALLVPLVRLRIESGGLSQTRALVVGEAPAQPGGPLRPFRLDHGPRIFAAVNQRELAA